MLKTFTLPLFAIGLMITSTAQAKDLIPASVHDPIHANMTDCVKLANAYRDATAEIKDVPTATRKMARNARSFCAIAYYGKGVAIYERALHTLEK